MSKLQGISLNLSAGQLSDLFFNYDHPERDKLYPNDRRPLKEGPTWEEELQAIRVDAESFCETLAIPERYDQRKDYADALADDFMARR